MVVLVVGAAVLTIGLPAGITVTGHSTPRPPLLHELRAVLACPSARVVTGLLALVSLLVGALDLGFVVTAVDVLHLSGSAAAWLNAAFGLGMVLGGIAFGTIQRRGLARWVVGGLVLWAVVLLALCTITSAWIAAAMLAGGGLGAAAAEVAGRTLLQRIAGRERLATAFSVVESTQMAALALGTLSVGAAVQWFGPRAALVVPGAVLLAVTAAVSRAVLRSERHATDLVVATRFA
jgi:predicted MFS family arabinose efflux permease